MRMRYIIMAGGHYETWQTPRHLLKIKGEPIVQRTIRLLRENGIDDIAISSDNPLFKQFGVPMLIHKNTYKARAYNDSDGYWCDAFYPMDEPACYLFGDVVFSPAAIKKIIETQTDSIEFFASARPFAKEYPKDWIEPFAFKVQNQKLFRQYITEMKARAAECWRIPIAWELWALIKGRRLDIDDRTVDYTVINDYTCDIDTQQEIRRIKRSIPHEK